MAHETRIPTPESVRANKVAWTLCLVGLFLSICVILVQAQAIKNLTEAIDTTRRAVTFQVDGRTYTCSAINDPGEPPEYYCIVR